jgi:stage III sporulation protein AG
MEPYKNIGISLWRKVLKLDKQTWMVLLLLGVLLLVIALPVESARDEEAVVDGSLSSGTLNQGSADAYEAQLEQRLEDLISRVQGIGSVKVMVTLEDQGEKVLASDPDYETREILPEIRGVCVVAQGVSDDQIRVEIYRMVQALFSLESHKISIVEMGTQEGT